MVSPLDPAVEVQPESQPESPEAESPDQESPEMIRARELIEKIETLVPEPPKPRSISGKRRVDRLADSRRLLRSRIASIPDFKRHCRKCQVCHSRYVEEIEEAYFNWSSAQWIISAFHISYDDAVYRHARAIGLDIRRRKNLAVAVEKLIEKVDEVTVTSSTILRAVRALSCLNNDGRWTDLPTTHVIVTTKDLPAQTTNSTAPTNSPQNESPDVTTSSTERSEPFHENSSGSRKCASASVTSTSTERSEPDRVSDIRIPEAAPTALAEQGGECDCLDTSPLLAVSNRGTMKN